MYTNRSTYIYDLLIDFYSCSDKGDIIGQPFWDDIAAAGAQSAASVRAMTYCDLHCINGEKLLRVLDFYHSFRNSFIRNLTLSYNLRNRIIFRKISDDQTVIKEKNHLQKPRLSVTEITGEYNPLRKLLLRWRMIHLNNPGSKLGQTKAMKYEDTAGCNPNQPDIDKSQDPEHYNSGNETKNIQISLKKSTDGRTATVWSEDLKIDEEQRRRFLMIQKDLVDRIGTLSSRLQDVDTQICDLRQKLIDNNDLENHGLRPLGFFQKLIKDHSLSSSPSRSIVSTLCHHNNRPGNLHTNSINFAQAFKKNTCVQLRNLYY